MLHAPRTKMKKNNDLGQSQLILEFALVFFSAGAYTRTFFEPFENFEPLYNMATFRNQRAQGSQTNDKNVTKSHKSHSQERFNSRNLETKQLTFLQFGIHICDPR